MNTTTQSALARFQDAFARALLAPDASADPAVSALTSQPAFAVYRNTVIKGCIDALQANYPAVERLVGVEWFRAAAVLYVRQALPTEPMLLNYGADFSDFLEHFGPAAELSYLPGVALLDRYWSEAHAAPDSDTLDPAAVARLAPAALGTAILHPHPAARWEWFDDAPIYSIWSCNRTGLALDEDLDWQPEGALLTRPHDSVQWIALDEGGCLFLDACAAGETVAMAAQAALAVQSNEQLTRLMATLLTACAFDRISLADSQ